MKKPLIFLALVFLLIPVFDAASLTVLVNSVQPKEYKDLTLDEKKALTSIENGVMDTLFAEGFIFFSQYLNEESVEALNTAREAGADFLLIINPDCSSGNIKWKVVKVDGSRKMGEGTIERKKTTGVEQMSESEFFYFTGEIIGKELVTCARNKGGL
jgi:hypothetical protein